MGFFNFQMGETDNNFMSSSSSLSFKNYINNENHFIMSWTYIPCIFPGEDNKFSGFCGPVFLLSGTSIKSFALL